MIHPPLPMYEEMMLTDRAGTDILPEANNERHTTMQTADFYDTLAPEYDLMTGFEKRFVREKPFFQVLKDRYKIRTALDAGSGTGFHSLLLARLGVEVTAVDLSGAMLERLQRHAESEQMVIHSHQMNLAEIRPESTGMFDAVVCMGNTLAHLMKPEDLQHVLNNFYNVLHPTGVLFVQVLNYDQILRQQPEVIMTTTSGDKTFTRSYRYDGAEIDFQIETASTKTSVRAQNIHTHLRPVRRDELVFSLLQAGFKKLSCFGGISMEPFVDDKSHDLVFLALKDNA